MASPPPRVGSSASATMGGREVKTFIDSTGGAVTKPSTALPKYTDGVDVSSYVALLAWTRRYGFADPVYSTSAMASCLGTLYFVSSVTIPGLNRSGMYDSNHKFGYCRGNAIGHNGGAAPSSLGSMNRAASEALLHVKHTQAVDETPLEERPRVEHALYLPNGDLYTPENAKSYANLKMNQLRRNNPEAAHALGIDHIQGDVFT